MFEVSVTLLILLAMGTYTNPEAEAASIDYDSAWDELFGHLSVGNSKGSGPKGPKFPSNVIPDKTTLPKTTDEHEIVPPAPAALPFVINSDDGKIPNIGANSYGNMEGIAISQNRGISLGIYMVNSSYNSFNTVFGNSNITKGHTTRIKIPIAVPIIVAG